MNLVTRRTVPEQAIGGRAPSGRNLFLVPWRGRALFGTWESGHPVPPSDLLPHASDVQAFIVDINHAFPSLNLTASEVTLVHRGIVPAIVGADGSAALAGREQVHDHELTGTRNLVSVAGTKYTTARAVAEKVTDLLLRKIGRSPAVCRTAMEPLPVTPFTGDELLAAAARDEWVETLEDAVVRRPPLGATGDPGDAAVQNAARIVGDVLGWDRAKRDAEIESLARFYDHAPADRDDSACSGRGVVGRSDSGP